MNMDAMLRSPRPLRTPTRALAWTSAWTALAFLGSIVSASAQDYSILNFKTNVGSFKLQGTDTPAHGLLEFTFSGTVLVSGLVDGTITTSPGVIREYYNAKYNKQVFHAKPGKITIKGGFRGVQFFGTDVAGRFVGFGLFRPYGEFDRNLNTGEYWYQGGEHSDWGTGGPTIPVPGHPNKPYVLPKPTVKQEGSGKRAGNEKS